MRAKNYRHPKGRAYTRTQFVKGFPPPKINKFTMGDTKTKFEYEAKLIALEEAQIRHNALEASRIATNRELMEKLTNNYLMRVYAYPHTILRENKMIFGAHADRLQDGMRRSFGKAIGTAAHIKSNQTIISINMNTDGVETAKRALKLGSTKLPIPCKITIEKTPTEEVETIE
jgi:large subunit ribosomal protein L10e